MNKNEIMQALASRQSGGFFSLSYAGKPSGLKAAASRDLNLVKRKTLSLQACDYAKRKAVSDAIKSGQREAPALKPFLEYLESADGNPSGAYFARHITAGTVYLCAPHNADGSATTYELDGQEVPFESIRQHFTPSALAPRKGKDELAEIGQVPFRMIKLENIESIR